MSMETYLRPRPPVKNPRITKPGSFGMNVPGDRKITVKDFPAFIIVDDKGDDFHAAMMA